jgi:hypothetical protein
MRGPAGSGTAGNVLRFKPPLTSSEADLDKMLDLCEETIGFVKHFAAGPGRARGVVGRAGDWGTARWGTPDRAAATRES